MDGHIRTCQFIFLFIMGIFIALNSPLIIVLHIYLYAISLSIVFGWRGPETLRASISKGINALNYLKPDLEHKTGYWHCQRPKSDLKYIWSVCTYVYTHVCIKIQFPPWRHGANSCGHFSLHFQWITYTSNVL